MLYEYKSLIYKPEIESWKDKDFKTKYFDEFLNKYAIDGWEVLSAFTNAEPVLFTDKYKHQIVVVFKRPKE